jgi:hypothetical protein
MDVRPAVEADADAMAAFADLSADSFREVIHDRAVRVAVRNGTADAVGRDGTADPIEGDDDAEGAGGSGRGAEGEGADGEVVGFVCFDAGRDAVYVTGVGGTAAACERLLEEPVRFGRKEGLPVEFVVSVDDDCAREAAEAVGFVDTGAGPRFDGTPTRRYRADPGA